MFISRVKSSVTEDVVREYIGKKLNLETDQVAVKEIETKYNNDSKCFQVGIDYKFKDRVYEDDFWPIGVSFRRYKFNFQKIIPEDQHIAFLGEKLT